MASRNNTTQRHVFVFDNARSCSNLLAKLFSAHPDLKNERHPYQNAMTRGPEKIALGYSEATTTNLTQMASMMPPAMLQQWGSVTFAQSHEELKSLMDGAEQEGKKSWIQDHTCYCIRKDFALASLQRQSSPPIATNPTHMPDDLLRRLAPVILIRHPALAFPSFLRANQDGHILSLADEAFDFWIHLEYSKYIYDYFEHLHQADGSAAQAPVVIDAEDLVHRTDELIDKLCEMFGISRGGVRTSWAVAEADEALPKGAVPRFYEELRKSTGVVRGDRTVRDEDIDIDAVEQQWCSEFGEEATRTLRSKVDAQLPVYWALWKLRLRL